MIEFLTMQQVFDRVATHLLTQNAQSKGPYTDYSDGYWTEVDNACAYRGANGMKCAVGCLIPDDEYDERFEGAAVTAVRPQPMLSPNAYGVHKGKLLAKALRAGGVNTTNERLLELLSELQQVHDTSSPKHWREELLKVAKTYGLGDSAVCAVKVAA